MVRRVNAADGSTGQPRRVDADVLAGPARPEQDVVDAPVDQLLGLDRRERVV